MSGAITCPQIDLDNLDTDGMPLAPPEVLTSPDGAWCVFKCAMDQATSFHVPTETEKSGIIAILTAFYQAKLNGGPSIATTSVILANAKLLGLQVCRAKYTYENAPASVLLFYTAPNIKDYSGPFMMLKETKSSNFVIYGPHDDSDGTYATTKLAMMNSYALACFSDGHKRGQVSNGNIDLYRESDWVHAKSVNLNLGDVAINKFAQLYPNQVAILFNGIADPTKSMLNSRNADMEGVFKQALINNTRLAQADFTGYTPWFTIDDIIKSNYYIKCEIPSVIYENNPKIVTDIVLGMEANSWCWSA
jgi:hypothetical protein